jgi:hypothetical protein
MSYFYKLCKSYVHIHYNVEQEHTATVQMSQHLI